MEEFQIKGYLEDKIRSRDYCVARLQAKAKMKDKQVLQMEDYFCSFGRVSLKAVANISDECLIAKRGIILQLKKIASQPLPIHWTVTVIIILI